MKRQWSIVCLLLLLVPAGCRPARPEFAVPTAKIDVFFSPRGGCTEAIVGEIETASQSIFIQAYSFTSKPIAAVLLDAHHRGVHIEAILDKSNRTEQYSEADFLAHAGIPIFIDAQHEIAHNKIMILDGRTVITGSFNFTQHAETSNAENLLVIRSEDLAAKYLANWETHKFHSDNYGGREESAREHSGREGHTSKTGGTHGKGKGRDR